MTKWIVLKRPHLIIASLFSPFIVYNVNFFELKPSSERHSNLCPSKLRSNELPLELNPAASHENKMLCHHFALDIFVSNLGRKGTMVASPTKLNKIFGFPRWLGRSWLVMDRLINGPFDVGSSELSRLVRKVIKGYQGSNYRSYTLH